MNSRKSSSFARKNRYSHSMTQSMLTLVSCHFSPRNRGSTQNLVVRPTRIAACRSSFRISCNLSADGVSFAFTGLLWWWLSIIPFNYHISIKSFVELPYVRALISHYTVLLARNWQSYILIQIKYLKVVVVYAIRAWYFCSNQITPKEMYQHGYLAYID